MGRIRSACLAICPYCKLTSICQCAAQWHAMERSSGSDFRSRVDCIYANFYRMTVTSNSISPRPAFTRTSGRNGFCQSQPHPYLLRFCDTIAGAFTGTTALPQSSERPGHQYHRHDRLRRDGACRIRAKRFSLAGSGLQSWISRLQSRFRYLPGSGYRSIHRAHTASQFSVRRCIRRLPPTSLSKRRNINFDARNGGPAFRDYGFRSTTFGFFRSG